MGISNNDKTVRIFHLAQNRVLTTLHLNVATNHASISPDGQHLVIVGDFPKVYFYHPATSSGSCPGTPGTGIGEAGCESWILSSHPPLSAGTDALISTSFSPSSLLCAVASQDGSITIFDTRYLSCTNIPGCPSPIVNRITSSRPRTYAGAVRSVQFSPAPWDLLIWAEHSGRVCVADARSNFRKRQVVDILVEKDDLIEAEVMSVDGDDDTQHSWRRREGSAGRRYTREEEESEEDAAAASEDDVHAFFSRRFDELSELVSRVRGNSHEWWATPPPNPAFNYPPSSGTSGQATTSNHPQSGASVQVSTSAQSSSTSASTSPPQTASSTNPTSTPALLRDYRERQIERERARQRIHDPPRRRNSTHPSYADQLVSAVSVSTRLPVPVPTPSAPPMPESNLPSQRLSWNTSSEPRSSASRPLDVIFTEHQRNREQLSALIAEERRRTYLRRRAANGGSTASVDDGGAGYRDDRDGVDITGCTLSLDGSKL